MRKVVVLEFITLDGVIQALGNGTLPLSFKLTKTEVTPSEVIFLNYKRVGKVKTGSFAQ